MTKLPATHAPPARRSFADEVLQALTEAIEKGVYGLGTLLPAERLLATQFGVSRVVVREAAKKLEQRGLISIRQGIGVRVVNDRARPIQDSFYASLPEEKMRLRQCAQARALIEPELAALAAQNPRRAEFLPRLRAEQDRLRDETEITQAALRDIGFHEIVAEMAGNKVLCLMLASIAELGRLSREHTLREFGAQRAYDFHATILAAIEAGDAEAARQAMRTHLATALGDVFYFPADQPLESAEWTASNPMPKVAGCPQAPPTF
jgi:GntR family transcriptional repressor for pyruvate dehydrogenase complex